MTELLGTSLQLMSEIEFATAANAAPDIISVDYVFYSDNLDFESYNNTNFFGMLTCFLSENDRITVITDTATGNTTTLPFTEGCIHFSLFADPTGPENRQQNNCVYRFFDTNNIEVLNVVSEGQILYCRFDKHFYWVCNGTLDVISSITVVDTIVYNPTGTNALSCNLFLPKINEALVFCNGVLDKTLKDKMLHMTNDYNSGDLISFISNKKWFSGLWGNPVDCGYKAGDVFTFVYDKGVEICDVPV